MMILVMDRPTALLDTHALGGEASPDQHGGRSNEQQRPMQCLQLFISMSLSRTATVEFNQGNAPPLQVFYVFGFVIYRR